MCQQCQAQTSTLGQVQLYIQIDTQVRSHTIAASFGLWSETLATGVTTSYAWDTSSIAADLYAQIPNANSGTGTQLYTYNGATLIGTKTLGLHA